MESTRYQIQNSSLCESFSSARTDAFLGTTSLKLTQSLNPQFSRQKAVLGIFYGINNKIWGVGRPVNAAKHGEFTKWDQCAI